MFCSWRGSIHIRAHGCKELSEKIIGGQKTLILADDNRGGVTREKNTAGIAAREERIEGSGRDTKVERVHTNLLSKLKLAGRLNQ